MYVNLGDQRFENAELRAGAEDIRAWKFTSQVGIQIEASMAARGKRSGQVLCALDPRVPVRHREEENFRQLPAFAFRMLKILGDLPRWIAPTILEMLGFAMGEQGEVKPPEVVGADTFLAPLQCLTKEVFHPVGDCIIGAESF